jgi:RNA polymerase sigma-70 factor (ECF subfamily)
MSEDVGQDLERARDGDRESFARLVRRYQRRVFFTAYRMTGNHDDAGDVAQEAFIRAHQGLGSYDGRSDFFTWLYRIVVNVSLNHLRGARRRPTVSLDDVALPEPLRRQADGDPGRSLELKRKMVDALDAVEALPETLRVTFVLVVLDGLSYRETGEVLQTSEGTVAWRVHEARKRLRRQLGRHLDGAREKR